MEKEITYKQFKWLMLEKEKTEKYLNYLTKMTRKFMYDEESVRVKSKKEKGMQEN